MDRPPTFRGLPRAVLIVLLLLGGGRAHAQEREAPGPPPDSAAPPAAEVPTLSFRPHGGLGWTTRYASGESALGVHAGGRILLSAGEFQRFGVEATYVADSVDTSDSLEGEYLALGIVLEMTLFEHFLLAIGTIGYVGLSAGVGSPFGLVPALGWEPAWAPLTPFVSLRSEWVFEPEPVGRLSLSVGGRLSL
ncbi:MAG: hypothetical protein ACFCGT_04660 [Sandaracinaceae bacterium]